jgi:tetratricopeptide (TPR) repeat protein
VLVGLGVAWYVRGSYEQAAQRLCEAADLAPNDPTPYSFLVKIINIESSESAEIASRFERFVTLVPQSAAANYYFAVSLWKQRNGPDDNEIAQRVQVSLEKAIALDPKFSEAFLQLGIVQSERKDFAQAIAAYRKAIELDPRIEQAHYRLAQAYRISGQNDRAKDELRIYEELSKENAAASERERTEVKQFVYTMREQGAGPPQP